MKTIIKSLLILLLFNNYSCVNNGEFEAPDITITEPNIRANSSLAKVKDALKQAYNSTQKTHYTFPINGNNPTYIKTYVVSNDAAGNFYKKLIVQDAIEDPEAGIEILINKSGLNTSFNVGQKVYIKLDGLTVSYDDGQSDINPTNAAIGKYNLGFLDGISIINIPSTVINNHFFRSSETFEIVPTSINLSTIEEKHLNTLIRFEKAQFEKTQIGKTFAGEPHDEFDGFRYLLDCESQQTVRLQTSTFSSFKSTIIPELNGSINAILTKDYSAKFLVTIINTPSDIHFESPERCDPAYLNCGNMILPGNNILFNEDFENIKSNSALLNAGWNNINANDNSAKYSSKTSNGNRSIEFSAYNSGESIVEVWLVSPPINLDNSIEEVLTFDTNTGYDNGKVMKVYVSSDFNGEINTATWTLLDAKLSEGPTSGYGTRFTNSGNINLSCLSGNVHVAFQYIGGDGGITTTFKIDNVKVTGN